MMPAEYEDRNDIGADVAWGWASIRLGAVKSPS